VAALEKLSIDTPEQISLEFPLATVGSRFLALAIDTLIQIGSALLLFIGVGIGAAAARFTLDQAAPWLMAIAVLGLFVIYYVYFAFFEAAWNGQTPGKRLIGLRVIHVSGRPVSALEAILRNVVRIADQLPGIYAVGIVSVFLTERSQRLGDLAAGTVVVHEHVEGSAPRAFATLQATPAAPTSHGATNLTPEEISVVELFFRRRDQLDGHARVRAARRIAERIRGRLGITAPIENEQLLEEVLTEYRTRGTFR
jgi:uncharacterized RDD family membrane protein YckC